MEPVTDAARRVRAFLDERGKGAWLAAMILGFIIFWPVGLAVLFYMIWSKRMFGRHGCHHQRHRNHNGFGRGMDAGTGNTAFDTYREETLKRLEDEQSAFIAFLTRLRSAKDKAEFDQFMDQQRSNVTRSDTDGAQPA